MKTNLGVTLSPILEEIEIALFEHQCRANDILVFTPNGTRASIKIFMDSMLASMWQMQEHENMNIDDRGAMAERMGNELRSLIKTYTNIDTHKMY
jgi:hypothetical protein